MRRRAGAAVILGAGCAAWAAACGNGQESDSGKAVVQRSLLVTQDAGLTGDATVTHAAGDAGDAGPVQDADANVALPGWHVGGIGNTGSGVQMMPPVWHSRPATAEEMAAAKARKAAHASDAAAPAPQPTLSEATIAWAATQPNQDALPITLVLAEPPFEWDQLRGTTGSTRANLIAQRKVNVQPSQSALMAKLTALGVTDMRTSWLGNHVRAVVPASALPAIAAWPEVLAIEHPVQLVPSGTPGAAYRGAALRAYSAHRERQDRSIVSAQIGDGVHRSERSDVSWWRGWV